MTWLYGPHTFSSYRILISCMCAIPALIMHLTDLRNLLFLQVFIKVIIVTNFPTCFLKFLVKVVRVAVSPVIFYSHTNREGLAGWDHRKRFDKRARDFFCSQQATLTFTERGRHASSQITHHGRQYSFLQPSFRVLLQAHDICLQRQRWNCWPRKKKHASVITVAIKCN